MTPSISVICAAWQAAATLGETLASVRAQSLQPDEVIVVDDGSTDETAAIAEAGGAILRRQANGGTANAINHGVGACRGEFITFIDADDLWPADKLARQAQLLADRPAIAGAVGLVSSFVSPEVAPAIAARYIVPPKPQPGWLLGALVMRRADLERVGPFDETMRAGYNIDWFDRARALGVDIFLDNRLALLRRIRPGSLSHRSPAADAGYALMARRALQRRRAASNAD